MRGPSSIKVAAPSKPAAVKKEVVKSSSENAEQLADDQKSSFSGKESPIKALAVKLEALNKAIAEIQEDIEDEAIRKVEAEEKLKSINEEIASLSPGNQELMKKRVQQEIMDIITKRVAEKVEIERETKECEALIAEREFMIYELESLLAEYKGEFKGNVKMEVRQMEQQMSEITKNIAERTKENTEMQSDIKDLTYKIYELAKEADELKLSLMKFSKVKESLNTCIPTSTTPAKKSPEKPKIIIEQKKSTSKPVYEIKKSVASKKKLEVENSPEDDAFWFGGPNK